ncbi:MAG TPA: NfeD family protein [Anaerolineales bacterium]|nr:NfeD family protein [Anaerolineales bacterium]
MEASLLLLCFVGSFLLMGFIFLASAIRIVQEDTRLSVYRLGRYIGDRGPGIVIVIPFLDRGVLKELGAVGKTSSHGLAGAVGDTRTTVYTDGKVTVAGEEWDAISHSPISANQRVRVVRMILEVEKESSEA